MTRFQRGFLVVSLFALIVLACPGGVSAQSYYYGFGSYPWSVPLPVPGGYVDAANGNLHMEIPIASIAERGRVPYVAKLVYDSHIWQQVTTSGATSWQPTNVPSLPTTWGGWRLITSAGTGSGVTHTLVNETCYTTQGHLQIPHPYFVYTNFNWVAPDGHSIPFGGGTTDAPNNPCETSNPNYNGISRDASGYHISVTNYTTAVVFAPDGTQIFPNVKDTNGNFYSVPNSNGDVTDTRGQTPITTTVNGAAVTYKVQSSEGSYNVVVTTESIPVNTLFGATSVTEYSGNITVVSSITLPDNTTYQFSYDQGATGTHFGTLTSMTLPTGGTVDYASSSVFRDAFGNPYLYTTSCLMAGGTWSYTPLVLTSCGTTCSQKVTVSKPSGDQQLYTFTMFSGSMWDTQAAAYNGSVFPANLLESTTIGYNTSNPPIIQPISYVTAVPVASGNLTKQVTLTYDTNNFGNVVNRNEWNFYPGTLPSAPDRTYSYTYLPNSGDQNMVNKRSETKLTSGTSTYSDTVLTYDSYGSGLIAVSNVFGHDDTNFGVSYTARGNPTSISSSGVTTGQYTYDTTGQVLTSRDSASNTTTVSYSDCYLTDALPPTTYSPSAVTNAFPTKITLAATGSINLCYYWGSGKPASVKDQNGATTASHFLEPMDRHTHVIPPLGWTEWTYSANDTEVDAYTGITAASPTLSCTSAGSCRHDVTYLDSFGRFSSSQLLNDPDGTTTTGSVVYDTSNRIHASANPYRSTSDPTYGLESPSYDGLNRITQVLHADNNVAKVYFGAAVSSISGANTSQLCVSTFGYGYPAVSVDEAGKMREYWTDGFGRTIEIDEPDSSGRLTSNTCYAYLPSDNLYQVSHTVGSQTQLRSYAYDGLGRIYQTGGPESLGTNYYYTTSGGSSCSGNPANVCRKVDGRSITTTYTYDVLNRLTGKTYSATTPPTPAVTYSYDQSSANGLTITNGIGRLTSMTDGSGTTAWSYDADGRIITEKRTITTVTKTISYSYNGDGSMSSVTYPSGRKVNYSVGNAGRPQSATDTAGTQYAVTASYAAVGALSAVLYGKVTGGFNGFNASQSYDKRWDLTSTVATSASGTALSLSYCFYSLVSGACPTTGSSNNGNVGVMTNVKVTDRTETFAYDPLNRIVSATTQASSGPDCWGQTFADDSLANLYQINSIQTGCSVGALNATVIGTTNQLGFSAPPQPTYDNSGNMTNDGIYAYTFDAESRISSANGFNYTYDGNGLRVEKSNGTLETLYWRAITGDALAETDTSGNTKNEYVYFAGQRIAWWDGVATQNLYYIYPDAVGSTRIIAEANGTTCYDSEFTPYGQELNHTNSCPSTYNYRFTGYERDPETGLDYAFARYYSSRLGRFMSPDPLNGDVVDPQSLNRYAYVGNNPPNFIDPSGLTRKPCTSKQFSSCSGSGGDCTVDGVDSDCGDPLFQLMLQTDIADETAGWWVDDGAAPFTSWILTDCDDEGKLDCFLDSFSPLMPPSSPDSILPSKDCTGSAHVLAGNPGLIGSAKNGLANGVPVGSDSAAVFVSQFGGSKSLLRGAASQISGTVTVPAGTFSFSSVGDTIGSSVSSGQANLARWVKAGELVLELQSLPASSAPPGSGMFPVRVTVPSGFPCPKGTMIAVPPPTK